MSSELLAILLLVVVHLVAIGVLLGMLLSEDGGLRGWWPSDDSDDDGGLPHDDPPRGGGPPLADAEPSTLRLREAGRLADGRRLRRRRDVEPATKPAPAHTTRTCRRDGRSFPDARRARRYTARPHGQGLS